MKLLKLTLNKQTILDDEDYEIFKKFKWFAFHQRVPNYYAVRNNNTKNSQKIIYLHREILGLVTKDKRCVDHINGNGLDNQRKNLRICTRAENSRNQRKSFNSKSSKFKGVCWYKNGKNWTAEIKVNYKRIFLGYFNSEKEAAISYNKAASKYFGQFARLNKINHFNKEKNKMKKTEEKINYKEEKRGH